MKVYRDAQGNVINIGDWDYNVKELEDGSTLIRNPLPEGAYETDEEVIISDDGGLIVGNDYAKLRAAEYPDFRDYLDGLVKGDQAQVQAYLDACQAVKAKYPKA